MCLMFGVTAGIWFAGHGLARLSAGRQACQSLDGKAGRYLALTLDAFLVLTLLAAAVFARLSLLYRFDGELQGGAFYDMALVRAGGSGPWAAHGASYLYTGLLAFVLPFTGNKVEAGVMLQLVLQVAGMLLFYYAVRLLAGWGQALCALAVLAFAPGACRGVLSLTPEPLYFFIYGFGLLLCGFYGKTVGALRAYGNGAVRKKSYALAAACGFLIGYAAFLDVFGWTLLLPAAAVSVDRKEREKRDKGAAFCRFAVCAGVSLSVAFLALGIHAVAIGRSYGEALAAWLPYPLQTFFSAEEMFWKIGAEPFSWMGLLLCLCGMLNSIGFWFRKTQTQDMWILLFLCLLMFQAVGLGGMEYGAFLTAAEGVLAGVGICSMAVAGNPMAAEERRRENGQDALRLQTPAEDADGQAKGLQGQKRTEPTQSVVLDTLMEEPPEEEDPWDMMADLDEEDSRWDWKNEEDAGESGLWDTLDRADAEEGDSKTRERALKGEEVNKGKETNTGSETGKGEETETGSEAGKGEETNTGSETGKGKETKAGSEAGKRKETNTGSEAGKGKGTDTGKESANEGLSDTSVKGDLRETEKGESGTEENKEEEKPKVKLLENPLPLPKKHVKRVMSYAKDVRGKDLAFDLSVKVEDDFDL